MIRILIADDPWNRARWPERVHRRSARHGSNGGSSNGRRDDRRRTRPRFRCGAARHLDAKQKRHRYAEDTAAHEAGITSADPLHLCGGTVRGQPAARRAAGYVNKEAASAQLVVAIRTVVRGRKYVSPALEQILADSVSGDAPRPLHPELSQRQFQIFCKLAAGLAVSKIADELNLSVKTVSTYRAQILEKMAIRSNADITYYAIKNGLIQ
jgi:DNA-binding CsgD family transcriptional regulator